MPLKFFFRFYFLCFVNVSQWLAERPISLKFLFWIKTKIIKTEIKNKSKENRITINNRNHCDIVLIAMPTIHILILYSNDKSHGFMRLSIFIFYFFASKDSSTMKRHTYGIQSFHVRSLIIVVTNYASNIYSIQMKCFKRKIKHNASQLLVFFSLLL